MPTSAASPESFHSRDTLALVGRYATPLAVILVGLGLLLAPMDPLHRRAGWGLLAFSLLLNFGFHPLVARFGDGLRSTLAKVRASLNLWINVVFLILLGRTWPAIWLIMMLSAVGTAIYGTRERTLITGVFLSVILAAVNGFLGFNTPLDWGNVVVKASFILLISLMVNDLSRPHADR